MRSNLDFSSWQGVLSTLLGLVLVSVVAIGIRLLLMYGVQLRRERQNRQINERLKTLIAAYKTLGGSFTGELAVDPSHLRELRLKAAAVDANSAADDPAARIDPAGSDRRRRTRDAVETALSDVILLGTEAQVRLAARAANEMVAGRSVEIAELVVSLRDFIRDVLDLEAIPPALIIPRQGPARTSGGASAKGGKSERGAGGEGKAVAVAVVVVVAVGRRWAHSGRVQAASTTSPITRRAVDLPQGAYSFAAGRTAASASAYAIGRWRLAVSLTSISTPIGCAFVR